METLIKTERCADGTLAKYIKDAHGTIYVEFNTQPQECYQKETNSLYGWEN